MLSVASRQGLASRQERIQLVWRAGVNSRRKQVHTSGLASPDKSGYSWCGEQAVGTNNDFANLTGYAATQHGQAEGSIGIWRQLNAATGAFRNAATGAFPLLKHSTTHDGVCGRARADTERNLFRAGGVAPTKTWHEGCRCAR